MAINRLTDIVAAMKSKWTYGDKDFAYTFEVNEQHNTQYPYMMINPPNSEIPEVYGGWESYDFEIDFFDLYQTSSQQAVSLDQKWDNLQDLSLEWLDNLMIHYNNPTGANVGIYFLEESIDFERVKEVANDRLVQIKMRFTLRAVTRCIFGSIPSTYPNQITGLASWLRADSSVVFSIPTKRVSSVGDNSGNTNIVSQALKASQPLRYTYDGAADKTQFTFNNDVLVSEKNFPTDVSGEDLITNGNFSEIGSEELNGTDFPSPNTAWTVTGSSTPDPVFGNGVLLYNGNKIYQLILSNSTNYIINYEVSANVGSGQLRYYNGNSYVEIESSIGEHTLYFTTASIGSSGFYFNVSSGTSVTVLSASVKEVGQNWSISGTDSNHYIEFPGEGARFVSSTISPVLVLKQESILDVGSVYELTCTVSYTGAVDNLRANIGGTNTAPFTEGENTRIGTATSHTSLQFLRNSVNVDALITNVSIRKIQSAADWSIFEVSKINAVSNAIFGYYHEGDDSYIEMGTNASGNYEVSVSDGTTLLSEKTSTIDTGKYHIGVLRKVGEYLNFNYYDSSGSTVSVDSDVNFNTQTSFEKEKFRIGCTQTSNGLLPPTAINTRYLDGNFQEVIIYDRKLNDTETANVVKYLNNKYKIY